MLFYQCYLATVKEQSSTHSNSGAIAAGVVVPSVLLITVVILVITFLIWFHYRQKKQQKKQQMEGFTIDMMAETYQMNNPLLDRVGTLNQAGPHEKEFSSGNITFVRELGEGAFGLVYQGMAANIIAGEDSTIVAVKQLKSRNTSEDDSAAITEFFKGE